MNKAKKAALALAWYAGWTVLLPTLVVMVTVCYWLDKVKIMRELGR